MITADIRAFLDLRSLVRLVSKKIECDPISIGTITICRRIHSKNSTPQQKLAVPRVLVKEWITRREAALQGQRACGEPVGPRMSVAEMVRCYEGRERPEEPWGRSKKSE